MLLNLFSTALRKRIRSLARNATGREARVVAAKFSPLLSAFVALFALELFPGYGFLTAVVVFCAVMLAGAALAFALPAPFMALLRFAAADPREVVLWTKRTKGRRDES